ncbi:hypothetical protein DPEC_G00116100 [Dallia pectoralis]|uniref:Uncharacterized protein n=1 Tax=Dallia pectoralis TaxID=75939 RepID=A0ACC2GV42_DALPE|nr:hypothetical protein DPEC_G00116100 [Dallia pectoralis]
MHIKPGTWEASNTVCEPDAMCDPAVLVSSTNPESHIRNRRLSPGSGSCGGGGGGCPARAEQPPRQASPQALEVNLNGSAHVFTYRRDRRSQHKGRGPRREGPRGAGRVADRPPKQSQKERWVEDSLSLLKPPPAFPVQDSPAKLQPTISYASKVKSGAVGGVLEEDDGRPAIGVLLQNQWGLSFISEVLQASEGLSPRPVPAEPPQPTFGGETVYPTQEIENTVQPLDGIPAPVTTSIPNGQCREQEAKVNGNLTPCYSLREALRYHTTEWNATCHKQKQDPGMVIWYNNSLDQPA